jgi:predicted CoA-binding protein
MEGPSTPFNFDVLAQLANIPARITLYELLRLSKTTREALREALADSEVFLAQMPATAEEESKPLCLRCDEVVRPARSLTFTP